MYTTAPPVTYSILLITTIVHMVAFVNLLLKKMVVVVVQKKWNFKCGVNAWDFKAWQREMDLKCVSLTHLLLRDLTGLLVERICSKLVLQWKRMFQPTTEHTKNVFFCTRRCGSVWGQNKNGWVIRTFKVEWFRTFEFWHWSWRYRPVQDLGHKRFGLEFKPEI